MLIKFSIDSNNGFKEFPVIEQIKNIPDITTSSRKTQKRCFRRNGRFKKMNYNKFSIYRNMSALKMINIIFQYISS
jgi:hypothetical protein